MARRVDGRKMADLVAVPEAVVGLVTPNVETLREPRFEVVPFDEVGEAADVVAVLAFTPRIGGVGANAILATFPPDASLAVALAFLALASLALTFLMEGLAVASVLTPVLVAFPRAQDSRWPPS